MDMAVGVVYVVAIGKENKLQDKQTMLVARCCRRVFVNMSLQEAWAKQHISVGFALSVLIYKAMREPQIVETTNVGSTFFLYPYYRPVGKPIE